VPLLVLVYPVNVSPSRKVVPLPPPMLTANASPATGLKVLLVTVALRKTAAVAPGCSCSS